MRLNIRISTAGDRWMARFPNAEHGPDEWADASGRVDEAKIRAFFQAGVSEHFVTFGSDDDRGVLCAAYEFVWQLSCCIRNLSASHDHDCTTEAETSVDRRLEAKMNRDKTSFCRMDFDRAGGFVRVRVGYSNPKGIVGPALRSARTFAVDAVRIMGHISKAVEENTGGKARIVVRELAGAEGIMAEAAEKDRMQALAERHASCPNRAHGYCSPIDPSCPCYRAGKCVDPKEAADARQSA